jgi:hypothetical protein
MSDFCDFVPDDPSCQTAPEPVDVVDNGGDGDTSGMVDGGDMKMDKGDHDDGEMTWAKFDEKAGEYFHPMDGNLAYLGVAVGATVDLVMHGFVWHESNADTLSQAASGASNTDYYNLLHMVEIYGGLAMWGPAALTQLLATFGIMVGINMLVWGMVLPLLGLIVELGIGVLGFMAYNQFWDQATMATPNATAGAYVATMEREMALHTASHVTGAFELYLEMGNWLWAAYMNSSEEAKMGWREDKDFLMMLHLKPEDVKDWESGAEDDDMMMDDDMVANLMAGIPSPRKLFRF